MQITDGKMYRANSGSQLIFTAARPSSDTVFYRDHGGDFRVEVSKITATSFHLFVPRLNMSGKATIEPNNCFIWRSWAYCLQPNLFTGELTFAPEDPRSERIGSFLLVGKSDGYVVYISRDPQGRGSSYRAFIKRVNPEGGTLPRVSITNTPVLFRGNLTMMTSLGSISTGNGTWRDLVVSDYKIIETPTEVRFRKK